MTQLEPLEVNYSDTDSTDEGFKWDEVQPLLLGRRANELPAPLEAAKEYERCTLASALSLVDGLEAKKATGDHEPAAAKFAVSTIDAEIFETKKESAEDGRREILVALSGVHSLRLRVSISSDTPRRSSFRRS